MLSNLLNKGLLSLAGEYNNWLNLSGAIYISDSNDNFEKNQDISKISKDMTVYQSAGKNILQHIKIIIELQKLLPKEINSNQSTEIKNPLSRHPALNIARIACRQRFIDKKI